MPRSQKKKKFFFKEYTKNLLELIHELSKVAEYKVNIQTLILFYLFFC